ncbi:MAG TPA: hypothetical protein VK886_01015 [Vicinamibacterales bacterium]|nr:hypothetical protein [Vicinamibacterales bacterium]
MGASSRAWRGVFYAFGRGMDPRGKDGVRAHPLVFCGGVLFHVGIFTAGLTLALLLGGIALPSPARQAAVVLLAAAIASGLGLLVRRVRTPVLQAISVPDDYSSNLLVLAFLSAGLIAQLAPGAATSFAIAGAALVVYAPFSKIRHSVLFFVARARFGLFIGRRGVFARRAAGG